MINERSSANGTISRSSWPGLSRPSTTLNLRKRQDVDARDKPGHNEWRGHRTCQEIVMTLRAGCFAIAACAAFIGASSALAAEISPELIAKAKQEGQITYYTDLIVDQ